jgi:cobalt-zinc-cadmium efflux system outer membrane protein
MRATLPALCLALLTLSGCLSPVRQHADALICDRARTPIDLAPPDDQTPQAKLAYQASTTAGIDDGPILTAAQVPSQDFPTLGQAQPVPKTTLEKRLRVPPAVPGAEIPEIRIPSLKDLTAEQRAKVLDEVVAKHFPSLPSVGDDPRPLPGPDGKPLALADLQKLARANSPLLRQAAADVQAARGAAIQAGLYPNPTFGVTGITNGPSGGPTYGYTFSWSIKTMGKLKLAQAAATMDLANAELAYRRAETDLMAVVRGGYFAVLVARENIRASRALVSLTDEVYKVLVRQLKGGEVATYEPMQVGVFAAQARAGLITARNAYSLAWRQLAAGLGLPGMPLTEVAGSIRMPLPRFRWDTSLARILSQHTDVRIADNGIRKARFNLRLAEVTAIPDVSLGVGVINDVTPPGPERITPTVTASVPVPIFDRNQGAIQQMQGALMRANEEPHRVRADLTARLADAFRRYDETQKLLDLYRKDILPMQVQAFRATVKRHYGDVPGAVAYNDLIASEQNLVSAIGTYLTILGAQWQAVVDTANLLQTDDLFQLAEPVPVAPVPDLDQLLKLPCCHPCNPLPDERLRGADGNWRPGGIPPASDRPAQPRAPTSLPNVLPPEVSAEPMLSLPALSVRNAP